MTTGGPDLSQPGGTGRAASWDPAQPGPGYAVPQCPPHRSIPGEPMTTINMQPGEHDLVTDVLGAVVLGLTLGLVDLTADEPEAAAPAPRSEGWRCITLEAADRERE